MLYRVCKCTCVCLFVVCVYVFCFVCVCVCLFVRVVWTDGLTGTGRPGGQAVEEAQAGIYSPYRQIQEGRRVCAQWQ